MPHVERFGTYVILSLSRSEKIFGFHKNIHVKYKDLLSVKPVENAWTRKVLRGVRAPGTGIPYVVALGTWRLRKGKHFVAVYLKRPAYILHLLAVIFSNGSLLQIMLGMNSRKCSKVISSRTRFSLLDLFD